MDVTGADWTIELVLWFCTNGLGNAPPRDINVCLLEVEFDIELEKWPAAAVLGVVEVELNF